MKKAKKCIKKVEKKEHNVTKKMIKILEEKIEAENSWIGQSGYTLSSARIVNVLRDLVCEIYKLEKVPDEKEAAFYNLQYKE